MLAITELRSLKVVEKLPEDLLDKVSSETTELKRKKSQSNLNNGLRFLYFNKKTIYILLLLRLTNLI